jgi:hypothetical protein
LSYARQEENTRRAAKGLPPKTRRSRRKTPAPAAAALTPPHKRRRHDHQHRNSASMPAHPGHKPQNSKKGAYGAPNQPGPTRNPAPTGTSDPNVKTDLTET